MELTLKQIIDLDDRNIDVVKTPIQLRRFNQLAGPYSTISGPIKPETDADLKIIRAALLRIPMPPVYVTEEFGDGRLTCIKGARMVGLLIYAMIHGIQTNESALSRRLGDTDIEVIKFRPITGAELAQETINDLSVYQ